MTTLIVVMCHSQSQDILDRHLPLYDANGEHIVLFCPADAVVNPRGHCVWAYGTRSHHDSMANRRFKELINMLAWTTFDRFVIFEADALCLTPAIPFFFEWSGDPKGSIVRAVKDFTKPYLCGNVFHDNTPGKKFDGSTFIHPPLIFTRDGLMIIADHLNMMRDDCEQGFWDRMLGLACENAGIEPMDFMAKGLGFARNTVGIRDEQCAYQAAADGAVMFHGIKSYSALEAITQGHAQAKANGKLREGLEIPL